MPGQSKVTWCKGWGKERRRGVVRVQLSKKKKFDKGWTHIKTRKREKELINFKER